MQTVSLEALVSSRRFKDEIRPMEHASEVIFELNPVSFRYKPEIEPDRLASFGLLPKKWKRSSQTSCCATKKENLTPCATSR